MTDLADTDPAVSVTRSEEQLDVSTRWQPYATLKVSKRVVTETRTIEVELRREELVIEESEAVNGQRQTTSEPALPLTIVLHEEQPVISVVVVPVERVTVSTVQATGLVDVTAQLARERIDIEEQGAHPRLEGDVHG